MSDNKIHITTNNGYFFASFPSEIPSLKNTNSNSLALQIFDQYYSIDGPLVNNGGTVYADVLLFGMKATVQSSIVDEDPNILPFLFPRSTRINETNGTNMLTLLLNSIYKEYKLIPPISSDNSGLLTTKNLTFDAIFANGTINHFVCTVIPHIFGPLTSTPSDLIVYPLGYTLNISFPGGVPPFQYFVADGLYWFSSNHRSISLHDPNFIFSTQTPIKVFDADGLMIQVAFIPYTVKLSILKPKGNFANTTFYLPNQTISIPLLTTTDDSGLIINHYGDGYPFKRLPSDFDSAAFLPANALSDTGAVDNTSNTPTKVVRALSSYLSDITVPMAPKSSDLIAATSDLFTFITNNAILTGRMAAFNRTNYPNILDQYNIIKNYLSTSSIKRFESDMTSIRNMRAQIEDDQHGISLSSWMEPYYRKSGGIWGPYSDIGFSIGSELAKYAGSTFCHYFVYWNMIDRLTSDIYSLQQKTIILLSDAANLITSTLPAFQSDFAICRSDFSYQMSLWAPSAREYALRGLNQKIKRISSFYAMVDSQSFSVGGGSDKTSSIQFLLPSDIPAQTICCSDFIAFGVNSSYLTGSYAFNYWIPSDTIEICRIDTRVSDDLFAYQTNQTCATLGTLYNSYSWAIYNDGVTLSNYHIENTQYQTYQNIFDVGQFLILKGHFITEVSGNFCQNTNQAYSVGYQLSCPSIKMYTYGIYHNMNYSILLISGKYANTTFKTNIIPQYFQNTKKTMIHKISEVLLYWEKNTSFETRYASDFIELTDCTTYLQQNTSVQVSFGNLRVPVKRLFIGDASVLSNFVVSDSTCPLGINVQMSNLSSQTHVKIDCNYDGSKHTVITSDFSISDTQIVTYIPTPKKYKTYPITMTLIDPTDEYAISSDVQNIAFSELAISNLNYPSQILAGVNQPFTVRLKLMCLLYPF